MNDPVGLGGLDEADELNELNEPDGNGGLDEADEFNELDGLDELKNEPDGIGGLDDTNELNEPDGAKVERTFTGVVRVVELAKAVGVLKYTGVVEVVGTSIGVVKEDVVGVSDVLELFNRAE